MMCMPYVRYKFVSNSQLAVSSSAVDDDVYAIC